MVYPLLCILCGIYSLFLVPLRVRAPSPPPLPSSVDPPWTPRAPGTLPTPRYTPPEFFLEPHTCTHTHIHTCVDFILPMKMDRIGQDRIYRIYRIKCVYTILYCICIHRYYSYMYVHTYMPTPHRYYSTVVIIIQGRTVYTCTTTLCVYILVE